jgi:transposase
MESKERHGQFTSHQKTEAVLRVLKGESLETIREELGITIGRIERWKTSFVAGGSAELAKRKTDSSKSWAVKHSTFLQQWGWLLFTLVTIIGLLVVFMQRSPRE